MESNGAKMKCPVCRQTKLMVCVPMFYQLYDGRIGLAIGCPVLKPHLNIHCTNCDWTGKISDLTPRD